MICAGYMNILTAYGNLLRLPDARGRSFMKDKLCEAPRVIRKYKSKRSAAVTRDSREEARAREEISVGRSVLPSSALFPSLLADEAPRSSVRRAKIQFRVDAHREAPPGIPFPSTSPQLQRKGKSRGIWFAFLSLFLFVFFFPATIDDRRARRAVRYLIYRTAPASCKLVTARSRDLAGK